jgi:hypothetical protein
VVKVPTREGIRNYFHIFTSCPDSNPKEVDMGDRGKRDSPRRDEKKKPKRTLKEKRKRKKEKKK